MECYIFLNSLRSLEEFRKNLHVKIPPKSPSTNFQSLSKFKNPIFNSKIIFSCFRPSRPRGPLGLWPSQPIGRAVPHRPKAPGRPIQPARRSRLHRKYIFLFRSCLPEPAAFSLCHRHAGLTCRLRCLPRVDRPRSEISPRRRSPAPLTRASDAPELLQPSLITLPP
jgi:hypothetical protein